MEIIHIDQNNIGIKKITNARPVLLIGNFDGVHKGHQKLITHAKFIAKKEGVPLAVMSFTPHPRLFFKSDTIPFSIVSLSQKQELLEKHGVDYFYSVNFDEFTANTSAINFIHLFLNKTIDPMHIIIGNNFRFGKDRQGDIKLLKNTCKQYSTTIHIAELEKDNDDTVISSSLIREAIINGNIELTNKLLNWNWFIELEITKIDADKKQHKQIQAKYLDQNIIPLKAGKYQSLIKHGKYNQTTVFSLHDTSNYIKLFLQEQLPEHIYSVGDVISLYPESILTNIEYEKELLSV